MSVELLQTLSLVSYVFAGVLFGLSVALFFMLHVPKLIGEVSGSTERKAIESIRQQNATEGSGINRSGGLQISSGSFTPSGRLEKNAPEMQEQYGSAEQVRPAEETTVLTGGGETGVLQGANGFGDPAVEQTTLLSSEYAPMEQTTVLPQGYEDMGQTTVLSQEQLSLHARDSRIVVELELSFCGSTRLIE